MSFAEIYAQIRPRYNELAGQVALVTGSGRGIGFWIAARLAREGMRVLLSDRQPEDVQSVLADLQSVGAEAAAQAADLSSSGASDLLVDAALQTFGRLDLLVNNAADLRRKEWNEVDEGFYDYHMAVNLKAPFFLSRRAAEAMLASGRGGCILYISSVGGLRSHWRGLPYDVAKSGLDALARTMALDLARKQVRVNAIAPGATLRTAHAPGTTELPERAQQVAARIPMGRFAGALDIANMVAFLASDEAAYLTGQTLYVDGGLTAQLHPPGQDV